MTVELPEGWTQGEKDVTVYEWRCPFGEVCGKNYRLMYKKMDREEAVTCGAWHLYDKAKHPDLFLNWEDAVDGAELGMSETVKQYPVYYDEYGDEQQNLPKRSDDISERGNKGGKGKDRGGSRQHFQRSRGSRRSRSRSRRSSAPGNELALALPNSARVAIGSRSEPMNMRQGVRSHEVVISRVELDEMIDGLSRSSNATAALADRCQTFATTAAKTFEDQKNLMIATNSGLERLRRA